jgi:hypothetical protein
MIRFSLSLVLLSAALVVDAAGAASAQIHRVDLQLAGQHGRGSQAGMTSGRSTAMRSRAKVRKFVGTEYAGAGGETFVVHWTPPPSGLKSGSALILEYRRVHDDTVRGQQRQFTVPVSSPRKTTFTIPTNPAELDAGPINMWRVRLVHGGRLLAEKRSDAWK